MAGLIPAPNQPDMINVNKVLRPLIPYGLTCQGQAWHTPWQCRGHSQSGGFLFSLHQKTLLVVCAAEWRLWQLLELCAILIAQSARNWSKKLEYEFVLGVMHNWFEGVLQHHFRFRWGLNGTTQTTNEELEESYYYTTEDDAMDEGGISSTFWSDTIKNKLINAVLVRQRMENLRLVKGTLCFKSTCPWPHLTSLLAVTSKIAYKGTNKSSPISVLWTNTSVWLFPNLKILPNHHYALHIPQKLGWWGPLMAASNFPGERLIGLLQKCKTNANPRMLGHIGVTMMNKFLQLQRQKAQRGLDCAHEEKERIKRGMKFEMDLTAYNKILLFLQESTPKLCANSELPHPPNAKVLFNYVKSIILAECGGGKVISRQQPNNMIQYVADGHNCYGQVTIILELEGAFDGILVKVVQAHEVEQKNGLDKHFQRLNVLHLQLHLHISVHLSQVVSPVAYWHLPAWSFGAIHPIYLICPLSGVERKTI
ncbi:hypothetical protein VP01_4006g2 [Puccinia sorghi]|uniref:Uncharacterized protein n=1 Tax=Puccinia sorghi TaxID=27349 RepID=A0A0L6UST1_9BASI|nr:hypothetical protein VP01_4006g2 [Puccinia sorghi]